MVDVHIVGLGVVTDCVATAPVHGDEARVVPLAPLLPRRVKEGHGGHPDHPLLGLQQRVLVILQLQIVKLNPGILPGEIHKLLGLEDPINFVNEKDPGDVNIDLNQNFVRDTLVQRWRLLVLKILSFDLLVHFRLRC